MRKYFKWFLLLFLLVPVLAWAYDQLPTTPVPEDTGSFISWFFTNIKTYSGAGINLIVAFVCTVIIGIMKLTQLKSTFDKLGKWKFIIPILLGAVAELAMNFPNPFTWPALISMLLAGAMGTGTVAIALHHIWSGFTDVTQPKNP